MWVSHPSSSYVVLACAQPHPAARDCMHTTGSVTASNLFNQPGAQATLTATPNANASALASASLTLDYTTPYARFRCVLCTWSLARKCSCLGAFACASARHAHCSWWLTVCSPASCVNTLSPVPRSLSLMPPQHTFPLTDRAAASPSDASKPLQSPLLQLSGTTGLGPCVLGASLGADTSSSAGGGGGRITSWAAGINYNRMSADEGTGGVERLNGQQVCGVLCVEAVFDMSDGQDNCLCACACVWYGVVLPELHCGPQTNICCGCLALLLLPVARSQWGVLLNDTTGSGGGRTATLSLHQLVSGGRTSFAAEYTLPLNQKGECVGCLAVVVVVAAEVVGVLGCCARHAYPAIHHTVLPAGQLQAPAGDFLFESGVSRLGTLILN